MTGTGPAERPVALVTGASGGIGLELARVLAAHGHDTVLVARSADPLEAAAGELERVHGVRTWPIPLDLGPPAAPWDLARRLDELGLEVEILVNNAGFGVWGPFLETDPEAERRMRDLNVGALTALTKIFVRGMAARGRGRILNVSSTAAFQPGPGAAVYYATKAYVLSFSLALSVELDGTGVTVTALCPGPTRTGFARAAGADESRLFVRGRGGDPAAVARAGYAALMRGDSLDVPGIKDRLGAFGTRLVPRRFAARVVRWLNDRA
ncbi:MAG TPA: SDR family oxidoreductase [Gemmatimonadota bacterium]|nr:SDR family oxidoreductase [Gemmatimonadota bacterium]